MAAQQAERFRRVVNATNHLTEAERIFYNMYAEETTRYFWEPAQNFVDFFDLPTEEERVNFFRNRVVAPFANMREQRVRTYRARRALAPQLDDESFEG